MGFAFLLIASIPIQQKEHWEAPKEADLIKNPFRDNPGATLAGQKLYTNMCVVCHGNKGKGDGTAGVYLKPRPTNLISTKTQEHSDGAIYWKITEGKAPMPSHKSLLTEEQRWQLVNYIRKLAK
ncbi:MAG: cytochrome c [Paludibacter sp.]|nr:cytochrome c [Paludibacter sp.]